MRELSVSLGLDSVDLGFGRWKCEWLGELGVTGFHDGEKDRASRRSEENRWKSDTSRVVGTVASDPWEKGC